MKNGSSIGYSCGQLRHFKMGGIVVLILLFIGYLQISKERSVNTHITWLLYHIFVFVLDVTNENVKIRAVFDVFSSFKVDAAVWLFL